MKFKKSIRRFSSVVSEFPKPDKTKFERLSNDPIEGYEERLERYRNRESNLENGRNKFWKELKDDLSVKRDAIDICSLNAGYNKRARKLYKIGVCCTKAERDSIFRRIAKLFDDHVL